MLSCGLYLHPYGIEARCSYGNEEDLLMSHVERTPDAARARASKWFATALSRGLRRDSLKPQSSTIIRINFAKDRPWSRSCSNRDVAILGGIHAEGFKGPGG